MSSAPDGQAASSYQNARSSEIEAVAENFFAFIEEFETAISEGLALPAFAERLAQLQQSAERLI